MSYLNKSLFKGLTQLDSLEISNNLLTSLDKSIFNDLKKLTTLGMGQNLFEYLDEDIFNGLDNLKNIYLNSNKFTFLNASLFKNLTLISLDLSFNKFENNLTAINNLNEVINNSQSCQITMIGNPIYSLGVNQLNSILCRNFTLCKII